MINTTLRKRSQWLHVIITDSTRPDKQTNISEQALKIVKTIHKFQLKTKRKQKSTTKRHKKKRRRQAPPPEKKAAVSPHWLLRQHHGILKYHI